MKKLTAVILNEQHSLMEEQQQLLNEKFGDNWEIVPVPANGWTLAEQHKKVVELVNKYGDVVFASPVPFLMKEVSRESIIGENISLFNVYVFHNDNREKVELPNGKIIFKVAKTGWQLV
jgi:hypothetical protein